MSSAPPADFPADFRFGAATAAHQVEGDNVHSDWWEAEQAGRLPHRSGAACRHHALYAEDFDRAAALGHDAHRLSVEWARIEPRPGRIDRAALDHYRRVMTALRERGLEPFVTLQHFTLPAWFAREGGWLAADAPARFTRYAAVVAEALGDRVTFWLTVNEPTVYAKRAYAVGDWPPFRHGRFGEARRVVAAMLEAHRRAAAELHRLCPGARVGIAHSAPFVTPRTPATLLDRLVARLRDLVLNTLPVRSARPGLDWLGLNYYARQLVHWRPRGTAWLFGTDWTGPDGRGPRRFSDLGWEICPAGLGAVLRRYAALGLPLYVTENGLATRDEALRVRFLLDHLQEVARARADGVDVRGYFWWSLLDNYEWAEGFAPRFGLYETDYRDSTRRPRPVAEVYREICLTRSLAAGERRATALAGTEA